MVRWIVRRIFGGTALAIAIALACAQASGAPAAGPESFANPDQAVDALLAASRGNDADGLQKIFGAAGRDLVSSGDEIADRDARARFVTHMAEGRKIRRDSADRATFVVGAEEWPFPIPLVRQGGVWHFDVVAGEQEILNRRIGRNEFDAIDICRNYVREQREYAADLQLENRPAEYAQKFVSSPGQHDGLYWPAAPGEKESPIGPQMARARAEGYGGRQKGAREPYHGYYYNILKSQGASAPGGAHDYIVGGRMTGGFALIAFPAKYGNSGVMTFIVNQDGILFQKDLGPETAAIAAAITTFDPDRSWKTR
jgi:hypothetical protein